MNGTVEEQVARLKDQLDDRTKALMAEIELGVATRYTLADAIREGVTVSEQAIGSFADDAGRMCAMSAAVVAAKARGYM